MTRSTMQLTTLLEIVRGREQQARARLGETERALQAARERIEEIGASLRDWNETARKALVGREGALDPRQYAHRVFELSAELRKEKGGLADLNEALQSRREGLAAAVRRRKAIESVVGGMERREHAASRAAEAHQRDEAHRVGQWYEQGNGCEYAVPARS